MLSPKSKSAIKSGYLVALFLIGIFYCSIVNIFFLNFIAQIFILTVPFVIYYFVKKYAKTHPEEPLTFGPAFGLSYSIFSIAGLITETVKFLFYQFANANYLPSKIDEQRQLYERMGLLSNEASKAFDILSVPYQNVVFEYIIMYAILGSIASLIIAAVVKKKYTPFE
ncbi:MAG: DUF4199 domain-containing protein [Bacteroidota bacterium]|nr:DUF4199 domain-containing protein [Bacteroidota bacterium]